MDRCRLRIRKSNYNFNRLGRVQGNTALVYPLCGNVIKVPPPSHQLTQEELLPPSQKAERPREGGRGSGSVKENELHVAVYMLQELVLHLDVSAPQELEVHLDVYMLQELLLYLDVSMLCYRSLCCTWTCLHLVRVIPVRRVKNL